MIASPLFWHPKQYQTPFSGLIENDGDFSVWNGQRPEYAAADALQRDVLTDERDEIGGFPDSLHVLVENAHLAQATARRGRCSTVHTPRGRSSGRQPSSSTPRPSA